MKRYRLVGTLVLSFIIKDEQADVIVTHGTLESDGTTVWLVNEKGRHESITTANIIDIALENGTIESLET